MKEVMDLFDQSQMKVQRKNTVVCSLGCGTYSDTGKRRLYSSRHPYGLFDEVSTYSRASGHTRNRKVSAASSSSTEQSMILEDDADDEEDGGEKKVEASRLCKILSEHTIRTVIIGVLCMMLSMPWLEVAELNET